MAVATLFEKFGRKVGLRTDVDAERQIIADAINDAAEDIYDESEIPAFIKEFDGDNSLVATPNSLLVMPPSVGYIRAIRERNTLFPYSIRDAYSKYKAGENYGSLWFGWKIRGNRPLLISDVTATGVVTLTTAVGDPDLTVNITGRTGNAERTVETVTVGALSVSSVLQFSSIVSITKNKSYAYDITVSTVADGVIAKLYNNQLETRYLHVDVSEFPSASGTVAGLEMEVLYKEAYQYLYNDGDIFGDNTYDQVIIDRALSEWCSDNDKPTEAILRDKRSSRRLARRNANTDRGKVQLAEFTPHPHDGLIPKAYSYRNRTRTKRWLY